MRNTSIQSYEWCPKYKGEKEENNGEKKENNLEKIE